MGKLRWVSAALVVFGVSVWLLSGLADRPTLADDLPVGKAGAGVRVVAPQVFNPGLGGAGGGQDDKAPVPKALVGTLANVTKVHADQKSKLIKTKGIIGFGVMSDPAKQGSYALRVYTTGRVPPVIPAEIDGVPTYSRYMPRGFRPLQAAVPIQRQRLPRPVPIGTSISILFEDTPDALFPLGECYSGTIGCRVRDRDNNVYGLSNNHVLGLTDRTKEGAIVVQPASGDTACALGRQADSIGTFLKFTPFDPVGFNYQDSAIMRTSVNLLSNKTPDIGYGVPNRQVVKAFVGQRVQKMGRTTGYTNRARVTAINQISVVGPYDGGAFYTFDNQIEITNDVGAPSFGGPGDSGSLIVDDNKSPVALLFAGGGNVTIGNPIQPVLSTYNVIIDGDTEYDPIKPPPGKSGKFKPKTP